MTRSLVLALIFAIVYAPAAVAGETLLESAQRATRELVSAEAAAPPASLAASAAREVPPPSDRGVQSPRANLQQSQPGLATSGMGTRSKIFIAVAAAAAFAGIAYAIDQGVEDNTPSSLGLR